MDKKSHPLYGTLFRKALADLARAGNDYERRHKELDAFNTALNDVLQNPDGAPGVQPFRPDGTTTWENLYVFRSAGGWHIVYWYGETPDGAEGKKQAFVALLLFDSNGEPLKSLLAQARASLGPESNHPEGLGKALKEILGAKDPFIMLLKL